MVSLEALRIIEKVHELFKRGKLTLSAAESCTGGLISHYVTTRAGASAFFEAGVVTYSVESKKAILKLSPETLARHGVVSEETAREMAERVRALTNTDYSIATTGNLGPDVLEGKEKGLVYLAVSKEGRTLSRTLRLTGDREANKESASLSALEFLAEVMGSPFAEPKEDVASADHQ